MTDPGSAMADRLTEHLRAGVLLDLVPGRSADALLDEDEDAGLGR